MPVGRGGAATELRLSLREALQAVDGNPAGYTIVSRARPDTDAELIYELPAPTTFDRFAVPSVLETPSPSQTFVREVEVYGSTEGPSGVWVLLGSATLEFSEIVGNGTQEMPELEEGFGAYWEARGVRVWLQQEGSTVNGCYDDNGELEGTVSGSILRARGTDPDTGVLSLFVLAVDAEGDLRGVRSTNGAPFQLVEAPSSDREIRLSCGDIPPPTLGCGSVIHAINFDYDSATIRAGSEAVLDELFAGLQATPQASILIGGHTSSEGSAEYNLDLSERRSLSVVDALVARGIDGGRIGAAGRGEGTPIASNDDEARRSLNRRVEVRCEG